MNLGFLEALVNIDSQSTNVVGVAQVQALIARELQNLGFKTEFIANPSSKENSGQLLIGSLIPQHIAKPSYITFLGHADTVFDTKRAGSFSISPDKKRAFGAGIIDDKGGLVVALEGLKAFLKEKVPDFGIYFICSPSEEIGSPGFQDIFRRYSQQSSIVLGFEPALEDGSIIEGRRGNRWYHVQVRGRESHVGRNFKDGTSASHELINKLQKILRLAERDPSITINIGSINTGHGGYNTVCAFAEAMIDTRFSDLKSMKALNKKIERIFTQRILTQRSRYLSSDHHISHQAISDKEPSLTTYDITDESLPFSKNELSAKYIEKYRHFISEIEGKPIKSTCSGGTSDMNLFSRSSLIMIDGLGPTGGGIHTLNEFLHVDSLRTRSEALACFLKWVSFG